MEGQKAQEVQLVERILDLEAVEAQVLLLMDLLAILLLEEQILEQLELHMDHG